MNNNNSALSNYLRNLLPRCSFQSLGLSVFLLTALDGALLGQDSEVIKKIDVVGAQKITKENILFRVGLSEGDDLRTIDFSAILEKLWAIGVYDDIKIKFREEADGKVLIIEVVERPLVKEVDYRGGTQIGHSNIKDKIKEKRLEIEPDTIYDPDSARKIKTRIVDLAAEKGFNDPVVDIQLEPMGAGICRLVFDIKEGGKARIYNIKFLGNNVFSDSQLSGFFGKMRKTRKHWMFSWLTSHDLLVEKNLEDDIQKVKNGYFRLGYKDIFVGQPTKDIQDHTTARQKAKNIKRIQQLKSPKLDLRTTLTFQLLEGEKYYEGVLAFEGNEKVPGLRGAKGEEIFRKKIGVARRDSKSKTAKFLNLRSRTADLLPNVNRPMDFYAINNGIEEIEKIYRNASYAQVGVWPKYETREENGVNKVDTTIVVEEREKFSIRRIEFMGNDTTLDKVLRRAVFPLVEGAPFSIDRIGDSMLGLKQLGFFEIEPEGIDIKLVGDKPQVDITISGEEAGVNEFLVNGGYGAVFGLTLGASVSTKNLFGGGQTIALSVQGGQFQRSFQISFSDPYVLDKPFSLGVSLFDSAFEYSADQVGTDYARKQFTRGLGLSTGTRLATFMPSDKWGYWTNVSQVGISYSLRLIRMEGGQNYYFRSLGSQLTSSVSIHWMYNTVNHPFKPTDGYKFGVGFEYGGWQFATDKPFHRTTLESSYFKSYAERHIFALNASYGYLANLTNEELPIWDNFQPGGEMSIRGYRYGWVGTYKNDNLGRPVVIGGNKQFLANIEYQLKIADQFRALLFYDMGNAWGSGYKVFSESLRRSAGIELRFFLPISPAPMRLIWARKLNPYSFDPEGKSDFQFSMGTTF
ncbi:MAG: BamA/TamA family outer membrane protein [Holophagaceae bacterium]|nr:BamA/TamA family outer membrane protein [Holophagaceae bacterium]